MPPDTSRHRPGVPVLMYHSLSDGRHPDGAYRKYTITTADFRSHLAALRSGGFTLGSVADLVNHLREEGRAPENLCLLTFDDGHRSSLEMAEILDEFGARGTFYLTSEYCRERPDFLKPDEIRSLVAMGHEVGGHGATHRSLRHLPQEEMRRELSTSKAWLESVLGQPLVSMSLPAGQGGPAVFEHAFSLGYQVIGTSVEKRNRPLTLPTLLSRYVILDGYPASLVTRIAMGSRIYDTRRSLRSAALRIPKALLKSFNRVRE